MRYIGMGPVPRERTLRQVAGWTEQWRRLGFGIWAACDRETGGCIGRIGLSMRPVWDEPEVGWLLAKPFWGRGLATEGGTASLRFGFGRAGLDRIVSVCRPENERSQNVMRKIGMRHERDTVHPELGFPVRVFAVDRGRWLDWSRLGQGPEVRPGTPGRPDGSFRTPGSRR